jgi:hypothetical protein
MPIEATASSAMPIEATRSSAMPIEATASSAMPIVATVSSAMPIEATAMFQIHILSAETGAEPKAEKTYSIAETGAETKAEKIEAVYDIADILSYILSPRQAPRRKQKR